VAAPLGLNTDLTQYHVGWVFGGGLEYAVDDRWSWKLEYLYAPLDRTIDNVGGQIRTTDASLNIVRAGLNYRFGDGRASAAYLPAKAAPRSGWNGSYIGLHGGYAWSDLKDLRSSVGTAATKPDGGYGGFQGGYNWLFSPQYLLGFEIDTSFGSLKDSAQFSGIGVVGTSKIDDLGTARLRLGYLLTPETLVYATGGAAYAREKFTSTVLSSKFDHLGWTVGGGAEYKFAPEWSVKAEYLHAEFDTYKDNTPIVATSRTSHLKLDTVRVGINYYGPVIERFFGGR
jgi:outer membrane immunogenic protein